MLLDVACDERSQRSACGAVTFGEQKIDRPRRGSQGVWGRDKIVGMDDELITHVAAGTDVWTALAASEDDDKPPQGKGCLGAVLVIVVLAIAYVWL